MITTPQHRIDSYTGKGWWGDKTLHGLLTKAALQHPNRQALADQPNRFDFNDEGAKQLSYAQLEQSANHLATQFLENGIQLDDIVIVQLPNIVELVVCYYALSRIGAIVSPIPTQYGAHEIGKISATLDTSTIITIDRFSEYQLASQAQLLDMQVMSFGGASLQDIIPLHLEYGDVDATSTTGQSMLTAHIEQNKKHLDNANRILSICWTSGTTGTPKGVPRSHNMWLSTTSAIIDACDYRQGDRLLNPFPLVNMAAIGGFLFPAALQACSLILHQPLNVEIFLQQLQDEKINFTIAPPALLNQLAKSKRLWQSFDFSALRCVGSGSAPLASWMIEIFTKDYKKEVVNFYGSNEGICLLATAETSPLSEQRAAMFPRLGNSDIAWQGIVYEFANTRLIDTDTSQEITEAGIAGELLIDGPTIFDGYFGTANDDSVFTDDGYFRTGDLVEICGDPPHYYKIVGRCKDIINRGGMKISPSELDQILEGHPLLQEAAVCAYPDKRLGEKVCACIVPAISESAPLNSDNSKSNSKSSPSLQQINDYLRELGLARYKLPERIEVFESLPRNPMNKILRSKLSEIVGKRLLAK